ncbi:MAG: DUF3592 domain-containing protein [Pseudomonadota bacterium]
MEPYRRKHDRHEPRSWFSLFLRLGGWVALILGAVLVVLTLISATQLMIADQLDRDGRFAQAVVVDKRFEVTRDSDGDETTRYYATFRFKESQAGGQDRERSVDRGFYNDAAEGTEVTVRYLRSDPDTFEYEIGQYRRDGDVVRYIGLAFGIAGLLVLWRLGRQTNAKLLARKLGEKRFAQVVEIRETGLRVNERDQARLIWQEEDGQTGESLMRDLRELSELYRAGDRIVVFRRGEDVVWEGDVGPRAAETET